MSTMQISFRPTRSGQPPEGEIVGIVFSEAWQSVFLGFSDGSIYVCGKNMQCAAYQCAAHDGGDLEYLRLIPGKSDHLVTIAGDGSVMIWKITPGLLQLTRKMHGYHSLIPPCVVTCRRVPSPDSVDPASASVSNFLVFATDDGALNWWDLDKYSSQAILLDGVGLITALAIDVDEDLIAIGTADGDVRVVKLSSLSCSSTTPVHGVVTKLSFLPSENGPYPGRRRLAILTNESKLQIRAVDDTGDVQRQELDYSEEEVFDITPLNKDELLIVLRCGQINVLRCDRLCRHHISPPQLGPIRAALALVRGDDGLLCAYRAYSPGMCYLSEPVGAFSPLRNLGSTPNHNVHDAPLSVLGHVKGGLQETLFDVGMIPSSFEMESAHESDMVQDKDPHGALTTGITLAQAAPDFFEHLSARRDIYSRTDDETEQPCEHHNGRPHADLPRVINDFKTSVPFYFATTRELAKSMANRLSGRIWNNDHSDIMMNLLKGIQVERDNIQAFLELPTSHEGETMVMKQNDEMLRRSQINIAENAALQRGLDTVAVGISADEKEIYIAGNIKRCSEKQFYERGKKAYQAEMEFDKGQINAGHSPFGFEDPRHEESLRGLLTSWYPQTKNAKVFLLDTKIRPRNMKENRRMHAEMQIIAYVNQNKISMPIIGISKPACYKCTRSLAAEGATHVHMDSKKQNTTTKNWEDKYSNTEITATELHVGMPTPPGEPGGLEGDRVIVRQNRAVGAAKIALKAVRKQYTPRITLPRTTPSRGGMAKAAVGAVAHLNRRPRVVGGIGATIESVVDNWDRKGFAYADASVADAGVYETRMTRGVYAQAGFGVARAGFSFMDAEACGPNAAAGAQVGWLSGVSVFAHAEVAKAKASFAGITAEVGLNANTGTSLGLEGVSVSLLGFGVAIGPHLELDTPIASVSCIVM